MMHPRNISRIAHVVLVVLLFSLHGVESKKLKRTPAPSSAPSSSPSTSFPSALPSSKPTELPSSSPTRNLTLRPTSSPTKPPTPVPTARPTARPTRSPTAPPTYKPTQLATYKPTRSPTPFPSHIASNTQPTNEPTSKQKPSPFPSRGTPTSKPTEEAIITPSPTNNPSEPSNGREITMPRIQMALIVSGNDMTVSREGIQKHMSSYITFLFETKTGIEALDMISLELEVVPSTFVQHNVEYGFSIKIEGMLRSTNNGNVTEEIVREKVIEYFSSNGVNDLETSLHGKSTTASSVAELYVDGIVVFMRKGDGKASGTARISKEGAARKLRGLFSILAAAGGVLLVSCSILFYRRHYRSGTRSGSTVQHQSLKLWWNGSTSENHTDTESQNSAGRGDISVHVSMEELEAEALHRVDSYPREYDATRLDRIISDARSHHGKKKGKGGRGSNVFLGKR